MDITTIHFKSTQYGIKSHSNSYNTQGCITECVQSSAKLHINSSIKSDQAQTNDRSRYFYSRTRFVKPLHVRNFFSDFCYMPVSPKPSTLDCVLPRNSFCDSFLNFFLSQPTYEQHLVSRSATLHKTGRNMPIFLLQMYSSGLVKLQKNLILEFRE